MLGQGETGRAKLWRISHIKHVFRLFCLTPHCDVFYDVNMKNHKMRRCIQTFCSFLKCIFVFIRQMQWKLTGKWERDTGTAAHPAALNRRRRCVQTGTNKVFKSVPHLCPKETSMGVNNKSVLMKTLRTGRFFVGRACLPDIRNRFVSPRDSFHLHRNISTTVLLFPRTCNVGV